MDPPPPLPGAEAVIATIVGDAVQPTLVADADGLVLVANARAAEALGHDGPDAMAGRPAPEGTAALGGRGLLVTELGRLSARDGAPVRVTAVSVPIDLPDGPGSVVAFTDIVEADDDELRRNAPPRIASLRRVAVEIAGGMSAMRTCATAARETARGAGLPLLHVVMLEPDDVVAVVGGWSVRPCKLGAGVRYPVAEVPGAAAMISTRGAVRVDDLAPEPGRAAALLREEG
ncbi:MAG TPA: hypothetical protein VNT55_10485, partial [Baekduia sp.]|nr:hypothetical protein [Baekduia sp.]